MKKLYTLALSVFLCGSVFAQGRQTAINKIAVPQNVIEAQTLTPAHKAHKAPARANGFTDIMAMQGTYEWSHQSLLQGGAAGGELTITIDNKLTGEATISGFLGSSIGIKATINFLKGTVTIPNNQDLGVDSYGDPIFFYLKDVDNQGYPVDGLGKATASVGTINGKNIEFPMTDIWALGDYNTEHLGWYFLTYSNVLVTLGDPDEGWEDFGTAEFVDGWMTAGMELDPQSTPWEVNVQKSTTTKDLYRLNRPYTAEKSPFASMAKDGWIEFSIADPSFVLVNPNVFSGMENGPGNKLYFFNLDGFYSSLGFTKEDVLAEIPDHPCSTYADGVVTIPTCRFNFTGATDKAYVWSSQAGATLEGLMKGKITIHNLAGVDNIAIDNDSNAPVEYFNLQGVRVDNPQAGQLVIKRQGTTVNKVVIR